MCSSEEGDCCVSPLLGPDSSPEISGAPGQSSDQLPGAAGAAGAVTSDANNNEEFDSDSDTGLIKLW